MYVTTEGQNLEAGFNPKYFLDALRAIDDEEIFIDFGTSISPCIIRSVDEGDYKYMILPIRLKDQKGGWKLDVGSWKGRSREITNYK